MEFPAWATPGENRKLFGKATANGADELILSDFDATTGFLEGKLGGATFAPPPPPQAEWHTNTASIRILGDDRTGPHSTAIIVGRRAVLACAHSLDQIIDEIKRTTDETKSSTKQIIRWKYSEDYWVQARITKNRWGECAVEDRVRIKLYKFHEGNDWALFERADEGSFPQSEVAVIDTSLLSDPNIQLTHKNARVLHCPVSFMSSIKEAKELHIGCQISVVSILGQSRHRVKYEGRDLCKGSSGGAVFVYPSGAFLGMHSEAINEAEFDCEEGAEKSIALSDKRVSSEVNPHEEFERAPEAKRRKEQSDCEAIAGIAGGINGLGSALIVCNFPRLMHYIHELNGLGSV